MQVEKGVYEKKLGTRLMMRTGLVCAVFSLIIIGALVSSHPEVNLSAPAMDRGLFYLVLIILLLSLGAILVMAGLTASFIVFNIKKPMEAVTRGIENFDRGDLTSFIRLNRDDEWKIIENSLNSMASRIHENIVRREQIEEELRIARENAEAAAGSKSMFLANMSHEILTPMNGVIGMTELLRTTRMDSRQKDYVAAISASADALLTVLNDILDFSIIQEGKPALKSVPFNLRTIMEQTCRRVMALARDKGLEVLVQYPSAAPDQVIGDPARIRQIVLNLADNAVKFTETGHVLMDVTAKESTHQRCEFRIEVSDTGIGIPECRRKIIFDYFSQADESTTRRFGGTGLGLAIARRLVEMMGGTLAVDAGREKGSAFYFTLDLPLGAPGTSEEEERPELPVEPVTPAPEDAERSFGADILLVEDNPMNQRVAAGILRRFGCLVDVVENGKEALRSADEKGYDMIFMDAHMPVMNGFDATLAIREREKGASRIPVIAITALAMEGDRERCMEAGMDDYISKPIRSAAIKEVLNRFIMPVEASLAKPPPMDDRTPVLLNPKVLMDITGADPEIIEALIGEFLSNAPDYLKTLFEAIKEGDKELIFNASHRLKGMVANAGGEQAQAQLDEIETKARKGPFIPDILDLSPLAKEMVHLQDALLTTDWNSLCEKK